MEDFVVFTFGILNGSRQYEGGKAAIKHRSRFQWCAVTLCEIEVLEVCTVGSPRLEAHAVAMFRDRKLPVADGL